MTDGWIARLAEEERARDSVRTRAAAAATRKRDLVRANGQRLLDELHAAVVRDVDAFRTEFPGDAARAILFEVSDDGGGFLVRKPENPAAALSVEPHLAAASISCEYRFTPANGMPAREDRFEFGFTSDVSDGTLQITHTGTGHVFAGADALSEFLLAPVFTGRPR